MINTYNRYLVGLLLILLGSTLPITAQSDFEFPPDPGDPTTLLSYNVTVDINDSRMGYVSGGGKFKYGRTVTISTSAQSGYKFVKWQKDGEDYSTSTSFRYTVKGNVTFTAIYEENTSTGGEGGGQGGGEENTSTGGEGGGQGGGEENPQPEIPEFDPNYNPDFPSDPSTPTFPDDPGGSGGEDPSVPTVYHKLYLVPDPLGSCTFNKESGVQIAEEATFSVTAVPGTDMVFQGWYNNGAKVSDKLTYSSYMGTKNITLTAMFEYVPEFPDDPVNTLPNVIRGDVNNDGVVNVTDVVVLTNKILRGTAAQIDPNVADLTNDGLVNVSDVVALTTYCLKHK